MPKIRAEKRSAKDLLDIKRASQKEHYKRLRESRASGLDLIKGSFPKFNERFRKAKISF